MSDEPAESQSTVTVRLDAELARMARIVCAHTPGRGANQLKLVDYLDSLVRAQITADYERVIAEAASSSTTKKKGEGKPKKE